MTIQDLSLNPIDPQAASFLGFRTTDGDPFPLDIYSYLISSLRECDLQAGDELILRWLATEQDEFENTQDRIRSLLNLFDPTKAPAAALDFVRWIVGISKRLDSLVAGLNTAELRILISIAVPMWKRKGSERGMIEALEALTTRIARIVNWFDFRLISDEVELSRERLGFDPWMIDIPGLSPSVVPAGVVAYPDSGSPGTAVALEFDVSNLFSPDDGDGKDVRILYVPTGEVQVRQVQVGNVVVSEDLFGQTAPPSLLVNDYRVNLDPDEYVSDLRIVDDGTGVLNRSLVENIVRLLRPANERYNIRYVDFQDLFIEPTPLWIEVAGTTVFDDDNAEAVLEDGGADTVIRTDEPSQAAWTEYQASIQIKLRDLAGFGEMRFYYVDEDNFYALRLDPTAKTATLEKVTASVRSVLDTTVLPTVHLDVFYFLRISTTDTGAGHQIQYFLDEDLLGTVVDTDHDDGALAVAGETGQELTLIFADLFQFPLDSVRIGPTP